MIIELCKSGLDPVRIFSSESNLCFPLTHNTPPAPRFFLLSSRSFGTAALLCVPACKSKSSLPVKQCKLMKMWPDASSRKMMKKKHPSLSINSFWKVSRLSPVWWQSTQVASFHLRSETFYSCLRFPPFLIVLRLSGSWAEGCLVPGL